MLDLLSFQYFTFGFCCFALLISKEGREKFQVGKSTQKKNISLRLESETKYLQNKLRKKHSRARFWSSDLWVMGPARFHCATLLSTAHSRLFSYSNVNCLRCRLRYRCSKWRLGANLLCFFSAVFSLFLFWTDIQNIFRRLLLLHNRTFQFTVLTDILITLLQFIFCKLTIVL